MKIVESFRKAKIIADEYAKYSLNRSYPISMDDLISVVKSYSELEITTVSVGYESEHILARLQRYGDKAEIQCAASLNHCHAQYAVTKELSQIIIDTEDSFTKDFGELVAGLVDDSYQALSNNDVIQSENYAHFIACELLLPFKLRDGYIKSLDKKDTTYFKIAKMHSMPEDMVRTILHIPVHSRLGSIMAEL